MGYAIDTFFCIVGFLLSARRFLAFSLRLSHGFFIASLSLVGPLFLGPFPFVFRRLVFWCICCYLPCLYGFCFADISFSPCLLVCVCVLRVVSLFFVVFFFAFLTSTRFILRGFFLLWGTLCVFFFFFDTHIGFFLGVLRDLIMTHARRKKKKKGKPEKHTTISEACSFGTLQLYLRLLVELPFGGNFSPGKKQRTKFAKKRKNKDRR